MSGITKFKKILEIAIDSSEVNLPNSININEDLQIEKEIYLLDQTFIPIIALYSDFLYREFFETSLFEFKYIKEKDENLFDITLKDNLSKDFKEDKTPNSIRLLFLIEGLNQVFPNSKLVANKKDYYTNMILEIKNKILDLPDGKEINPHKVFDKVLKDILYVNIMNIKNQNKIKNK